MRKKSPRLHLSLCRLVIAPVAFCTALVEPALADDWPAWRGEHRDAVTAESGWASTWPGGGPPKLWAKEVGVGSCSVAVVGDRVFTVGNDDRQDTLFCLDAANGKELWKASWPAPLLATQFEGGPTATPAVADGRVYMLSREGLLLCFDAKTGQKTWSVDLVKDLGGRAPQWLYSTSPLVEGDLVVVEPGGRKASVAAFNKVTGKLVWKSGDDPVSYSSPISFEHAGRRCVAVFNAFGLVIYQLADGREVARHAWKTSYDINSATPLISGNRIFISSGYGVGGAMLEFNGTGLREVWKNTKMRNQFNSCVLSGGFIFGFDEKELRCLDAQTGAEKWSERGMGQGALIVADGKLVIMSESGELVVAPASSAGFQPSARVKAVRPRSWVLPVLANGKLFAKNNRGDLVCFNVRSR